MTMIDVWHAEDAQTQVEKIKALVSLIQTATEDYARVKGPFQSGFEMLCINLSNTFDLLDKLNTDLGEAVDAAYKTARE